MARVLLGAATVAIDGLQVRDVGSRGRGVFTLQPIAVRTDVLSFGGTRLARHEVGDFSTCLQVSARRWLGPSGGLDDLVNHSCDPNCGLYGRARSVVLVALRDIEVGEELSFDYSTSMRDEPWSMQCRCATPRCRGEIGDFARLPAALRARYLMLGAVLPHAYARSRSPITATSAALAR